MFLLQFDKKVLHVENGEKILDPFPVYRMPVQIEKRLDIGKIGRPPPFIIGDGLDLQANEPLSWIHSLPSPGAAGGANARKASQTPCRGGCALGICATCWHQNG
jgi:hypothetical protein